VLEAEATEKYSESRVLRKLQGEFRASSSNRTTRIACALLMLYSYHYLNVSVN